MEAFLWAHPGNPSLASLEDILVTVARPATGRIQFRYVVRGEVDEILLPAVAPPLRANNLWKTTCFEAFLAPNESQTYRELNFSPSTQWAAYDFAGYRAGMVQASVPTPPEIRLERTPDSLVVKVDLSIDLPDEPYCLGLAAVIEERGGHLSYWALDHPGDSPDFHRRYCFDLELPPPQSE